MARASRGTLRFGRVRPTIPISAVVVMIAGTSCAASSQSVSIWSRPVGPAWASVVQSLPPEQRQYATDLASLSDPGTAAAFGFDPRLLGLTVRQAEELAGLQRVVALWRSALEPPGQSCC